MIDRVKEKCVGCSACKNKCPQNCIDLKPDVEGFLYPVIDYKKCIKCGLCESICPAINKSEIAKGKVRAFAVKHKDKDVLMQSSSGGAFTLLAEQVLKKDGAVFGAAFDDEFNVKHVCVQDISGLQKLRGSKYVQSDIGYTYKQVEDYLKTGRMVLFSGTPCQVVGLKNYLKTDYANLITLDIACHGVPSPLVLKKYIEFLRGKTAKKLNGFSFRDKTYGWENFSVKVSADEMPDFVESHKSNEMMQGFLRNYSLRESCYDCLFKGIDRVSDVTLCDFWGIKENFPELYDANGVSLILVHSEKGISLVDKISEKAFLCEVEESKAVSGNVALIKSVRRPVERDVYLKQVKVKPFDKVLNVTEKKGKRITKIKIYKEDIDQIKVENGKFRATLYAVKHFFRTYL